MGRVDGHLSSKLSVPVLAAACLGILFAPAPAAAQPSPAEPFLTVHGPNDGEPLNNWVNVEIDVSTRSAAYLIFLKGVRVQWMVPVAGKPQGEIQRVKFPFDSTQFPNGRLAFRILLLNEALDTILDDGLWIGTIDNPVMTATIEGYRLRLEIRGRDGDLGFQISATQEASQLQKAPDQKPPRVQVLATGRYPPDATGAAEATVVLDLDSLIAAQTSRGFVVLWSYDPMGKWIRSKILPICQILASAGSGSWTLAPNSALTGARR